jgi:hypothetical protein
LPETRPSPSDILARITNRLGDQELVQQEEESGAESAAIASHLKGLEDFYTARRHWSWFLILCIAASLLFQIGLTISVGLKWLDFKDYRWFLPIVVSESFLQIVGLAAIVLKWIFSGKVPEMNFR